MLFLLCPLSHETICCYATLCNGPEVLKEIVAITKLAIPMFMAMASELHWFHMVPLVPLNLPTV